MAKPIIAYAVVRAAHSSGIEIIGVTSERGRRVYGRDKDDAPTNRAERDVLARYATLPEAGEALRRVDVVRVAMAPAVDDARRNYEQLQATFRKAQVRAAQPVSEFVDVGGRSVRRFIPHSMTVDDGTVRCIGCGQIDEDGYHDLDLHAGAMTGALREVV
jgi:hypothetical protein